MRHDWYSASGGGLLATMWNGNPMKVALLKPTYTPNRDTHKVWSDIAAHDVVGTGYTAAGQVLTGKTTPYDSATDRTDFRAADTTWGPGATFLARYAAVYDDSGTKPLWSLVDFEADKSVDNGIFTIDWSAVGLVYTVPVP